MQFVIKTTCITHGLAVSVPSPQCCRGRGTVSTAGALPLGRGLKVKRDVSSDHHGDEGV